MICQRDVDLPGLIYCPTTDLIDIGNVQITNTNETINNKHVKRIPVAFVESDNFA